MNVESNSTYAKEREAVTLRRPSLPPHAGEARYQSALDADLWFRGSVSAALLVALLAGSGFGRLTYVYGVPQALLYVVGSGWFAWRLLAKHTAKPAEDARAKRGPIIIGYAMTGAVAWGIWIEMGNAAVNDMWTRGVCVTVGCVVTLLFDNWIRMRSSFAPVLILVALTHLCTAAYMGGALFLPIAPQLACVLIEFALLGVAGYRHLLASQASLPVATYRSSPQCIVPRLDRAWDHPVKIDAA